MYNTDQAAEQLHLSPRALRRFMRKYPDLAQVGFGGRYVYSPEDIETIRSMSPGRRTMDPPELEWLNQTPGFTPEQVNNPRMKRAVLEQRRERQQRLNERLIELSREEQVSP